MVFKKGEQTRLGCRPSEASRKKMSDSQKKRIAEFGHVMTGRFPSEETKKKISSSLLGRKFSDEHRKKISESQKGNPSNRKWSYESWMRNLPRILITAINDLDNNNIQPYNNHSWKKLRKKVYTRDNFTCQECGVVCDDAVRISCHHIDFDKNNNEMSNLITLCGSCHGKTTQKTDEWIQYYQDKMMLKQKEIKTSSDAEGT